MINYSISSDQQKLNAQVRSARLLMIIPTLVMLAVGALYFYVVYYKKYAPADAGMWQQFVDVLIIGPIFFISVLIVIPCLIAGLVKLHKIRK